MIALSQGTKWRVNGLIAAASASNISLLIPTQPKWSEEFVSSFEAFGPVEAHGAALAWLGHIDMLKLVIQNKWGSALIMEDDVDWDVRIRWQTRLIAAGVRELTQERSLLGMFKSREQDHSPYGDNWDVLWMGHCSDPPDMNKPVVSWEDQTVIDWEHYTGLDRYMTTVLKEGQRSVHASFNPVCTFAYAVSASGAKKALAIASTGKGGAFDLMLNGACRSGHLRCVSVNPEVFDSYHPAGGDVSEVRTGDAPNDPPPILESTQTEAGHTDNIRQSARCQGLWRATCLTSEERRKAKI